MRARRGAPLLLALLLASVPGAHAAPLLAGAASVAVAVPEGTPLGGYGGFPRRAWVPDLLGRAPHAFWFRPATGVHDPVRARALALESGSTRILWLTVDLVGVDPSLLAELRERLARAGLRYSALILSASHTHSGPGAYADSALFALVALDRLSVPVRASILDALEQAGRQAEARREPARLGTGRAEVGYLARSRLGRPLDAELGVLKVVGGDGRAVALVWNYAIHGTALGRANLLLSGDLMAHASALMEQRLHAPALFVQGAVGDVSPAGRGWDGVRTAGEALAAGALGAWREISPEADARLAAIVERVALPEPEVSLANCLGGWIPRWVRVGLAGALPASAELVAVAIGRGAWVTIPGELETRLGLTIKAARSPAFPHVFVAGVSNDYLGYFLTPEAHRRPSYIACASLYGERGGEVMREAASALVGRLADRLGDGRAVEGPR